MIFRNSFFCSEFLDLCCSLLPLAQHSQKKGVCAQSCDPVPRAGGGQWSLQHIPSISSCPWVLNCNTTWANTSIRLPACLGITVSIWRSILVANLQGEGRAKGSQHIWSFRPSMTMATHQAGDFEKSVIFLKALSSWTRVAGGGWHVHHHSSSCCCCCCWWNILQGLICMGFTASKLTPRGWVGCAKCPLSHHPTLWGPSRDQGARAVPQKLKKTVGSRSMGKLKLVKGKVGQLKLVSFTKGWIGTLKVGH